MHLTFVFLLGLLSCLQLPGGGLRSRTAFRVYFRNGGVNTFVSLFGPLYEVVKQYHGEALRYFQNQQTLLLQRSRTDPPPLSYHCVFLTAGGKGYFYQRFGFCRAVVV